MKFFKRFRRRMKDTSGELMVELMVGFILVVVAFLYFIDGFNLYLEYQNVSYSSKSIAKVIECDGAVTDRAYEQLAALNKNFNMDMTFEVSDVKYFDSRDKSIQFRDPFKVTVRYNAQQVICSPLFSKPIVIDIPMKSDVPGMSEVYWK